MKEFVSIAGLILLLFASACTSSPKQNIVNRWKFIDQKGKYHNDFQQNEKSQNPEIEFTKDGKYNAYQNGVIMGSTTYTMASDGKSVLVSDPQKGEISFQIIDLSKSRLVMTSAQISGDTLIFERR